MSTPTLEQWDRHCSGQDRKRVDDLGSTSQGDAEIRREGVSGAALAIVSQSGTANDKKLSAGQRRMLQPYRFTFGKFCGCTLDHVKRVQPTYIRSFVNATGMINQPKHFRLRKALLEAGYVQKVSEDVYEAGPQLPKRPNWRYAKFGEPRQPHHCALCGSTDHNISTCVKGASTSSPAEGNSNDDGTNIAVRNARAELSWI